MDGELREYLKEKSAFLKKEVKRERWLWAGVITQVALATIGVGILPVEYYSIWSITLLLSCFLMLWGLLSLWLEQRKFSSFEKWMKHRNHV